MKTAGVVAALLACSLAGCRSAGRAGPEVSGEERLAEARRIAVQAQRAERAGETARAIDLYRQSIIVSDRLYAPWNELGLLLMAEQNYMDAVQAFHRSAELEPTDPRPLENIGLAYQRLNHEQKALEFFLQALERDPRSIRALRGAVRSSKLLNLGDEPSLERVRTALMIETDPDWRALLEREQSRIEGQISAKAGRLR